MPRTLIVNADDLGMTDGINRGIVEAHRNGIVTSSTVMTNLPAAQRGIDLAQREAPRLGLGLHVNLTYGHPVLPPRQVPSLVRADGAFVDVTRGLSFPQNWHKRDVAAEIEAQLAQFVMYAGRPPDHLDAHQLVTSLSIHGRQVVLDVAARYGLPIRRGRSGWFGPFERFLGESGPIPDAFGPLVDRLPRPWRRGPMEQRTPVSTDGLELRFFAERATVPTLLRIVDELTDGVTELVCHPGHTDDDTGDAPGDIAGDATAETAAEAAAETTADDYAYRAAELAALTDPRVAAKVAEAGVVLATFGDLAVRSNDHP